MWIFWKSKSQTPQTHLQNHIIKPIYKSMWIIKEEEEEEAAAIAVAGKKKKQQQQRQQQQKNKQRQQQQKKKQQQQSGAVPHCPLGGPWPLPKKKKKKKVQQSSHKNWLAPPLLDILPPHISPAPIIISGPYSPKLPPLVLGLSYSK